MSLHLRPATGDDEAFLQSVYASTRLEELALTRWDQSQCDAFIRMQFTAQRFYYENNFPGAEHLVIVSDGRPVGRLFIARTQREIRILDITVLPEHRSSGIGSAVVKGLLDESRMTSKPVSIHVESFNRSLTLFNRLGFQRAATNGVHYLMEWNPSEDGVTG